MKSEIRHRKTRRLNGWDYRQRAIYSITVTLADRSRPWLGRLVLAENDEPQNREPRNRAENGALLNGVSRYAAGHSWPAIAPTAFGEAIKEDVFAAASHERQSLPKHHD